MSSTTSAPLWEIENLQLMLSADIELQQQLNHLNQMGSKKWNLQVETR